MKTNIKNRIRFIAPLLLCAFALIAEHSFAEEEKIVTEVPVHVGKIMRATLHSYVTAYGSVEPEPATQNQPSASARVASPFAAVVSEAKCYEGQQVKKDDLLFRLDSRTANVAVQTAEKNFERQKKLLSVGGTSQRAVQEAEQQLAAARAQLALLEITAPLSGTIVAVHAKPGEAVDVNSFLAEIIDLNRLVVTANVPASEVTPLKTGADVKFDKASDQLGKLVFISPQVDVKTGTVLIRASLPQNSNLRPGQFLEIQIVSAEAKNVLAVPIESIVKNGEGQTVISIVNGDHATQKVVKTGLRENDLVEVSGENLRDGMQIVTVGAYGLPAETKIHVVAE